MSVTTAPYRLARRALRFSNRPERQRAAHGVELKWTSALWKIATGVATGWAVLRCSSIKGSGSAFASKRGYRDNRTVLRELVRLVLAVARPYNCRPFPARRWVVSSVGRAAGF